MLSRVSKHQRWDSDGNWLPGKCRVFPNASIRKLMRAARQGKMPDERQVLIDAAIERAGQRRAAYLNSCPAKDAWKSQQRQLAK
jgi:hypothetical protein